MAKSLCVGAFGVKVLHGRAENGRDRWRAETVMDVELTEKKPAGLGACVLCQVPGSAFLVEHPGHPDGHLCGPMAGLPPGGSTLAPVVASILASPGGRDGLPVAAGGRPEHPRAAQVASAVAEFLAGRGAGPRQARRGSPALVFTNQPAQAAPATMPAAPADAGLCPQESPPAAQVGESVKGGGPQPPEAPPVDLDADQDQDGADAEAEAPPAAG